MKKLIFFSSMAVFGGCMGSLLVMTVFAASPQPAPPPVAAPIVQDCGGCGFTPGELQLMDSQVDLIAAEMQATDVAVRPLGVIEQDEDRIALFELSASTLNPKSGQSQAFKEVGTIEHYGMYPDSVAPTDIVAYSGKY